MEIILSTDSDSSCYQSYPIHSIPLTIIFSVATKWHWVSVRRSLTSYFLGLLRATYAVYRALFSINLTDFDQIVGLLSLTVIKIFNFNIASMISNTSFSIKKPYCANMMAKRKVIISIFIKIQCNSFIRVGHLKWNSFAR